MKLSPEQVRELAVAAHPLNGSQRWVVRELYNAFRDYNDHHFGGQLPVPFIFTESRGLLHCLGSCRAVYDRPGIAYEIFVDLDVVTECTLPDKLTFARHVLIHEMIHELGLEFFGTNEPARFSHGSWFAAQCNRIGAHCD